MRKDKHTAAAACVRRHRKVRQKDSISSLPDEVLQHILCFIPTKLAVSTSLLSSRWRHVWCDTPSISLESSALRAASRMKTQNRYTAPKVMSLHLLTGSKDNFKHVSTWIEMAMSRRVEKMDLELHFQSDNYDFPEFFYINSSVKELRVELRFTEMIPKCSVSWTSLKKLSFRSCSLPDDSIDMILSGCPILEFLKLDECEDLEDLDLSNALRLRTLQVFDVDQTPGKIVAPHVRCLKLRNSLITTLGDLSSLAEAKLNISFQGFPFIGPDYLGVLVVEITEMLEKLHNVEKLTFGRDLLENFSRPELGGVPFPKFKRIKALALDTPLSADMCVIIEKLLQQSPGLKTLTIHTRSHNTKPALWKKSRWQAELKHMATSIERLLKKTKALEKVVVQVDDRYFKAIGFEEMAQTLSRNYKNASIVFSTKPVTKEEW
ncbi:unnamed protein product [Microthlaspi erraticum]|uniref:F-box domain-containing protein n=1 Tax=Microthlaspi erraticum TaxID=1685480 RepID=A0A6D2K419_9BRAS|nr:unnamed protein product [Microthlaspi erraticum]